MTIHSPLIGRFGNQMFQFAYALRRAGQMDCQLSVPPWLGEKIFDIPCFRSERGPNDIVPGGYAQNQESLIYSRKWLLDMFRIRPELKAKLDSFVPSGEILAHLRRGDYEGYKYPLVSRASYLNAAEHFGFDPDKLVFVSEDEPLTHPDFAGELAFLPDFYRMMRAKVLFRANSSFSWWASTLGEAMTFSPCIKGKPGGVISDCTFDWGNHQQLAELPNITDLHLFSNEDRYNYPLNGDSLVIDAGGYDGEWTREMHRRHNCWVLCYEPIYDPKIPSLDKKCQHIVAALGGANRWQEMRSKGSMAGMFADDGNTVQARVYDVAEEIGNRAWSEIGVLKLNIEGMEFEVLERILECGLAGRISNLQVQFHPVVPNCRDRYYAIREGLLKTHRLTYDCPWTWENYERRT